MRKVFFVALALLVAACAQIPPSPQEIEAKKFETAPDKAVVYIVRSALGRNLGAGLALDGRAQVTTWPGTFYRWVVAPGTHTIEDTAPLNESITLQLEAGKIYFVEHWVVGARGSVSSTRLQKLDDKAGRQWVTTSTLL
jgi:hypothetical protein